MMKYCFRPEIYFEMCLFQTNQRRDDPHLQLRGPRRPRQPGPDHHHHGERGVRGSGPVSDQHEVGGGVGGHGQSVLGMTSVTSLQ